MFIQISKRKEILTFSLIFLLIYLQFVNIDWTASSSINFDAILSLNFNSFFITLQKLFSIYVTYIACLIVLLLVYFYFADLIKAPDTRKIIKRITLILLLVGQIFILYQIRPDITSPFLSDSSNINSNSISISVPESILSDNGSLTTGTSSTTTIVPSSSPPNGIDILFNPNLSSNYLNIIILVAACALIMILVRTFQIRRTSDLNEEKDAIDERKIFDIQEFNRKEIIGKYLKLSNDLEDRGINSDFSLTPIEFGFETVTNLSLHEMSVITYYYELVRFSNSEITSEDIDKFNSALEIIYSKMNALITE